MDAKLNQNRNERINKPKNKTEKKKNSPNQFRNGAYNIEWNVKKKKIRNKTHRQMNNNQLQAGGLAIASSILHKNNAILKKKEVSGLYI